MDDRRDHQAGATYVIGPHKKKIYNDIMMWIARQNHAVQEKHGEQFNSDASCLTNSDPLDS